MKWVTLFRSALLTYRHSSALSFQAERCRTHRKGRKPFSNRGCVDWIALPERELLARARQGWYSESLQLEFGGFEARHAGVLDAARFGRVLPDEVAIIEGHPAVCVARNYSAYTPRMRFDRSRVGRGRSPSLNVRSPDGQSSSKDGQTAEFPGLGTEQPDLTLDEIVEMSKAGADMHSNSGYARVRGAENVG